MLYVPLRGTRIPIFIEQLFKKLVLRTLFGIVFIIKILRQYLWSVPLMFPIQSFMIHDFPLYELIPFLTKFGHLFSEIIIGLYKLLEWLRIKLDQPSKVRSALNGACAIPLVIHILEAEKLTDSRIHYFDLASFPPVVPIEQRIAVFGIEGGFQILFWWAWIQCRRVIVIVGRLEFLSFHRPYVSKLDLALPLSQDFELAFLYDVYEVWMISLSVDNLIPIILMLFRKIHQLVNLSIIKCRKEGHLPNNGDITLPDPGLKPLVYPFPNDSFDHDCARGHLTYSGLLSSNFAFRKGRAAEVTAVLDRSSQDPPLKLL